MCYCNNMSSLLELKKEDKQELEDFYKVIRYSNNYNLSNNVYKKFKDKVSILRERGYEVSSIENIVENCWNSINDFYKKHPY